MCRHLSRTTSRSSTRQATALIHVVAAACLPPPSPLALQRIAKAWSKPTFTPLNSGDAAEATSPASASDGPAAEEGSAKRAKTEAGGGVDEQREDEAAGR